jgi:endoglycosylceramidase
LGQAGRAKIVGRALIASFILALVLSVSATARATPAKAKGRPSAQAKGRPKKPKPPPITLASPWSGGMVRAHGGPWLTDAQGRRLILHGIDVVGKCGGGATARLTSYGPCVGPAQGPRPAFILTPTAEDPGRRFTAADAVTLARLGFDVVRLGVVWQGLEPGPPGAKANEPVYCSAHTAGRPFPRLGLADPYSATALNAYLAKVDTLVDLLSQAGLRVVIDMHQDDYGSYFYNAHTPGPWNGEGAPPWATCTGQVAFKPTEFWFPDYHQAAEETAIHHFFMNDVSGDLQGQYDRVWAAVARHFRDNPDVIGYEVYNEPTDYLLQSSFTGELQCFYGGPRRESVSCHGSGSQAPSTGVIGAIQAVDHHHVVVYEPPLDTYPPTHPDSIGVAEPLRFPRLALAFHDYNTQQANLMTMLDEDRARTRTAQAGGPPWFMDEFGGGPNVRTATRSVDLADGLDLSWSYWAAFESHDPTGAAHEGLLDENTRRPAPGKARALDVPYPAATSGRPGQFSSTRAGRVFRYTFAPQAGLASATEIVVPVYTYPTGYRVWVLGARVVSATNSSVLKLRTRPGASTVKVTVRPR